MAGASASLGPSTYGIKSPTTMGRAWYAVQASHRPHLRVLPVLAATSETPVWAGLQAEAAGWIHGFDDSVKPSIPMARQKSARMPLMVACGASFFAVDASAR